LFEIQSSASEYRHVVRSVFAGHEFIRGGFGVIYVISDLHGYPYDKFLALLRLDDMQEFRLD